MPVRPHRETHRQGRVGWLRAAVLGAQDGIVSTASLIVGVAAASSGRTEILVAGIAALVAGAMSMAAGEYSSVSSQRDAERADIARETRELARYPEHELEELTQIYERRGLDRDLAKQVAATLMREDALGSHVRDELGIIDETRARPAQAAIASSTSFSIGAAATVIVAALAPASARGATVAAAGLVLLALLGVTGARLGGAHGLRPTLRIVLGGGIAMAVSALVGSVVGTAV
jgi:VIT1/CCC1 family predicted Fe2+/Mn2+ transporter